MAAARRKGARRRNDAKGAAPGDAKARTDAKAATQERAKTATPNDAKTATQDGAKAAPQDGAKTATEDDAKATTPDDAKAAPQDDAKATTPNDAKATTPNDAKAATQDDAKAGADAATPDAKTEAATTANDEAALPVMPRTSSSSLSPGALAQALAAAGDKVPVKDESPEPERKMVEPSALVEAKHAADTIALPRTMSEEWMAADADDGAYEEGPRRPRWIVPAIVAGIGMFAVAMIAVVGGGGEKRTRRVAQTAPADAAIVPIDAPAFVAVAPPIDAELVVTPVDAAVDAPIDAAVDAPTDAAVDAPVDARVDAAVDAAVPVVAVAPEPPKKPVTEEPKPKVTEAPKPKEPKVTEAPKPKEPKPKEPKAPAAPKDERSIEDLVAAGEFAKANKACTTNTIFSTPRLTACAIAACNTHSDALAARWIRAIPRASRDELIATCKSLGVDVATP